MSGVEAVVGGAFVKAIIKAVVDTGRSHFSEKHKKHKDIHMMLDNLNASIPEILSVIELAERKPMVKDGSLAVWLQQLKDVAYEAEDVMDHFKAKQMRESLENKGKVSKIAAYFARPFINLFLSDKDEIKLKHLVEKIEKVSRQVGNFINVVSSRNTNEHEGSSWYTITETSSHDIPKKIFGRNKDIDLILDMILGCHDDKIDNQSNDSNQEQPDNSWELFGNTRKFITNSLRRIKRIVTESIQEPPHHYFPFQDIQPAQGEAQQAEQPAGPPPHYFLFQHIQPAGQPQGVVGTGFDVNVDISFCVGNRILSVLPIVGIGGIGKTTTAQAIYNHPSVKVHFDLRGWVYVKDTMNYNSIVNNIVLSFDIETKHKPTEPIGSLDEGHDRLKNAVKHKRFLLIFDDVREGIDLIWDKLLAVLAEGAQLGSIVVVTTQSESLARKIGTLPLVFLDVLEWQHFLALFEYHAFGHSKYIDAAGNRNFLISQYEETHLKPIGREIAKKLHGLPLAAETIGKLLSINVDINYWEKILESDWWNLEKDSNNILHSLGVEFQSLDPDLMQCFTYCSLFPNNYVFDKERLIQMWLAQGFIHPTNWERKRLKRGDIRIEDIGVTRFDKLVGRFFFQTTIWENKYIMHNLIRELAIAISSEELYVSTKDIKNTRRFGSLPHHLAIDADVDSDFYVDDHMLRCEKDIRELQTIMFFGFCKVTKDKGIHNILYKLTCLRVLDLSYFGSQFSLPDKVISKLSHICFMDLSFSGITSLPNSIYQLVHLQVLNIRGCCFEKLPHKMNRLINLQHFYASPHTISLIFGIGKLMNLQELEEFRVREEKGYTVKELMDMDFLTGELILGGLEKILSKEEAISAKLDKKKYLTSLSLRYDVFPESIKSIKHMETLEGLKPPENIRNLIITKFPWCSFPSWIMEIHELNNLRSINLKECFYLETLPPLGSLPKLEILILNNLLSIICIGEELYGNSDVIFPCLKELEFIHLREWEHWSDPGKRQLFPCLRKLKITNCHKLSNAPLHCLNSTVVELYLSNCDEVVKNVGRHFAHMTSLAWLYLHGYDWLNLDLLCWDHLHELRVLILGDIELSHLKWKISSLINLKKLIFPRYREQISSSDRQHLQNAMQAGRKHSLLSLACIEVHDCFGIPNILFCLGRFPSLRTLWISNCDRYRTFNSMEDCWLKEQTSLEEMELSDCKNLVCLPPSLSTMSALKRFTLKNCPMILSLPQEGLPRSLEELCISECSFTLMQGCEPEKGAEWPKISHIPYIRVGKQTVQSSDNLQ